jgi:small redox-active disulfide protein 2
MKIEVLGPGCANCRKLYSSAETAVARAGVEAELVKVEGFDEIMAYRIAMTPALVIDGEVKSTGRVPRPDQIAEWLREAAQKAS